MKLAYLTSVYPRASDSFIRREVHELRRLGHEVHTFAVRTPGPDQLVSDEIRAERSTTTYLLQRPARAALALAESLLSRPGATIRAARLAWRTRAPGLKATLLQAAYLAEAALLAAELHRRAVTHLHNHIAENSASVAMLASELSGIPYSMTVHGPGIFYNPERWALGEKIARSRFTACISHFCRSQCMVWAPYSAWTKLHVVRCAVDDHFLREAPTPVPDRARFVTVGRLCEAKGQAILVEAAAKLAREGVDVELVLVGDGPLRPQLESLFRQLGVESRVRITGWLGAEGVRREMLDARCFVLSSFAEGLPVVLMEAMALARPVISTNIAAVSELIERDVSGWLVPPGSRDALAVAMREALEASPETLGAMGRAGRARVQRQHDIRVEAAKLAALFGAEAPVAAARPEPAPQEAAA